MESKSNLMDNALLSSLTPPVIFTEACLQYGILKNTARIVFFLPIFIVLLSILMAAPPSTRSWFVWLVKENRPVELLTFLFLMAGACRGIYLSKEFRYEKTHAFIYFFYIVFSSGLFLVAMEEIAWGQKFLHFKTPEALMAINAQGEVTLHNIYGLHGHSEIFRVSFGLGGLLGMMLSSVPRFERVHPPRILITWFLVITVAAAIDLFDDYIFVHTHFHTFNSRFAEVVEMMVGVTGFLYIWLNSGSMRVSESCI